MQPSMAVVTTNAIVAPSDTQLLSRIGSGDRAALEELFVRYRAVAYRVAYRLLGNEADALDAVQDAFAKALMRFGRLRGAQLVQDLAASCSHERRPGLRQAAGPTGGTASGGTRPKRERRTRAGDN